MGLSPQEWLVTQSPLCPSVAAAHPLPAPPAAGAEPTPTPPGEGRLRCDCRTGGHRGNPSQTRPGKPRGGHWWLPPLPPSAAWPWASGACGQTGRACPRPPQPATEREGRVTPEMSPSQGDPAGPLGDGSKVSLPGPLGPEKVQVSQPGHGHPGSPPGPRSGARGCRGPILSREAPGSGLRVGSQLGQAWETGSRRPALYHISHPTDEGGTGPREAGQPGEAWAGERGLGLGSWGPGPADTRPALSPGTGTTCRAPP